MEQIQDSDCLNIFIIWHENFPLRSRVAGWHIDTILFELNDASTVDAVF